MRITNYNKKHIYFDYIQKINCCPNCESKKFIYLRDDWETLENGHEALCFRLYCSKEKACNEIKIETSSRKDLDEVIDEWNSLDLSVINDIKYVRDKKRFKNNNEYELSFYGRENKGYTKTGERRLSYPERFYNGVVFEFHFEFIDGKFIKSYDNDFVLGVETFDSEYKEVLFSNLEEARIELVNSFTDYMKNYKPILS